MSREECDKCKIEDECRGDFKCVHDDKYKSSQTAFNWDDFKAGKIAVHCKTEELANDFLCACYARGIKWDDEALLNETLWQEYKSDTCYEYMGGEDLCCDDIKNYEGVEDIKGFCWEDEKYFSFCVSKNLEEVKMVEYTDQADTGKNINKGSASEQSHYQVSSKQPIEIMQETMTRDEFTGYLRGNVIKYALRMGHKDDLVKEAGKIAQYSDWLVKHLNGGVINPWRN